MTSKIERKLLPEKFDTQFLESMRTWDRNAAAAALDQRVRAIEKSSKQKFVEMGILMVEIEDREYWKEMPVCDGVIDRKTGLPLEHWHSMDQWLSKAAPYLARTSAYTAKNQIRELQDIPAEELAKMPRCNIRLLTQVPKHKRKSEVIEQAQTAKEEEFTEYIETNIPEAHVETKRPMRLKPEKSQRAKIDEAIDMAMVLESLTRREDALEAIAIDYITTHQEEYERETGAQA